MLSCEKTSDCDAADYADPAIELLQPQGPVIESVANEPLVFMVRLSAEAGLNTFGLTNGDHVRAFTNGEKVATITFTRWFWYDEHLEFVLHDLCDQEAVFKVELRVSDSLP
jgi:hypothetical protein